MTTGGKVTLRDVAQRAGVSRTTASYILNGLSGQAGISPDTEKRVRQVADALGYWPNRNARSLRTARTTTIGVITDYVASGMFSSEMLAGANTAARRRRDTHSRTPYPQAKPTSRGRQDNVSSII